MVIPGFANDSSSPPQSIMWADNVDFSGAVIPTGTMNADGQLLIGSSVSPFIAVGLLTSSDSSVTFTPGHNTLSIQVAGGATSLKTLTGNSGTATPSSGNIQIKTANATVTFVGSGAILTQDFAATTNLLLGSNGVIGTATNSAGVGTGALAALTNGTGNSAFGQGAGAAVNTGNENSFFGKSAGAAVNGGGQNLMCGKNAGSSLTSGSSNVILGQAAGSAYTAGESSNIIIGSGTTGTAAESHKIRIGTSGSGSNQQNACFIAGIDGVNVGSTAQVVTEVSGQLGTAVLTAGTGINITPTANVITISATGSEMAWTDESASFNALVGNGYFVTANATATLPASPSQGNVIDFIVDSASGILTIQANTGQIIEVGKAISASAGTAVSNFNGDSISLVYRASDTKWLAKSSIGTFTVT